MRFDSATLVAKTIVSGSFELTGTVLPGDVSSYDLGSSSKYWRTVYSSALSGSLTKLSSGGDYLVAGSGINLTTGSSGQITITSTVAGSSLIGGSDTQIQFNDNGTFGGNGNLTFNKSTGALTGAFIVASTGFSGSHTRLTDGSSAFIAGGNMEIVTGSNGAVTFSTINSGTISGVTAGTGLTGGGTSGNVTLTLSNTGSAGTYGSISQIPVITTDAQGRVTSVTNTSVSISESQVTGLVSDLGGRALTSTSVSAGNGLQGGGDLSTNRSLSIDNTVVATISGSTFSGAVKFNSGLSGSLTKLSSGGDYLIAGPGINISTGSNGSVTIGSIVAGSSFVAGTNSQIQFNDNGSFGASGGLTYDKTSQTLTSSYVVATSGLTGSLTRLSTGDPYLLAGSNVTISTGSNGSITISSVTNGSSVIAGSDSQVQFNDGGSFGASPSFSFNKVNNSLIVPGLSGSLTKLSTGADYLVAGNGIQISTGSSGNITIASVVAGSSFVSGLDSQVQFNDGGSFGGSSGLTYNKSTGALTGTYVIAATGFSGSLTRLSSGDPYLLAGSGIQISTGSSGNITISSTAITSPGGANAQVQFNDAGSFSGDSNFTFNKTTDALTVTNISGSLTKLSTGEDYLLAGAGISLSTGSSGNVTISSTAITSPGGSNTQVQFNDEGSFSGNGGLTYNKTTGALTGNYVVASTGFSGSLTKLSNGSDYLVAGGNLLITTGSSGQITLATINSGTIHGITVGTGITGGGTSGTVSLSLSNTGSAGTYGSTSSVPVFTTDAQGRVTSVTPASIQIESSQVTNLATDLGNRALTSTTIATNPGSGLRGGGDLSTSRSLSIDDSVVATISGSTFAGSVKFNGGLSGSLTKLSDGVTNYLQAGNNITITTGSNGSVVIGAAIQGSSLVAGSDTQVQFNDGGTFGANSGLSYNKITQALTSSIFRATTGFSGSLTKLASGGDYLIAGSGIQLTTGSLGNITITSTVDGSSLIGGADTQVQFNDNNSFSGNSNLTYNKLTGALTGAYVIASTGFSGSLTTLTTGEPYLVAGSNVTITTGSNGSITIDSAITPYITASFTSVTSLTVNHGIGIRLYDIEVFDSSYNKIFPKSIRAASSNQAQITFGSPTSGYVVIGGGGGSKGTGGSSATPPTTIPGSFDANGLTSTFTISGGYDANSILVFVNGIYFHPTEDYTVSGTSLIFVDTPASGSQIRIRYLVSS